MSNVRVEVFKPYLGVGKIYLKNLDVKDGPSYHVGNVSELRLGIDEEVIEQPDHTAPGGGMYAEVRRVNSVTVNMTMHDFNYGNLELATRGSANLQQAGTVSEEEATLRKGALLRLDHPAATDVVITDASSGSTTYKDYEVRAEGIFVPLEGDLATADTGEGVEVKVSYSYGAHTNIEALTSASKNWALTFGGLNEADGGAPVIVDLWKVSFGATDELSLIGNELGQISLEGQCLKDFSRTASTPGDNPSAIAFSPFYRIQRV